MNRRLREKHEASKRREGAWMRRELAEFRANDDGARYTLAEVEAWLAIHGHVPSRTKRWHRRTTRG